MNIQNLLYINVLYIYYIYIYQVIFLIWSSNLSSYKLIDFLVLKWTLNSSFRYSAVCQLYLSKTRRKTKQPKTTFLKVLNTFNCNTRKKTKRERNRRNTWSNNSLNVPKVIIDTKPQIQKAQQTPSQKNIHTHKKKLHINLSYTIEIKDTFS